MADVSGRSLKEIIEYRDLLNARDDAQKVVAVLVGEEAPVITATVTVSVKASTGGNVASNTFNKYLQTWLVNNMSKIAPEITELIEVDLNKELSEAEDEASLLGLSSKPTIPPAPVIISPKSVEAVKGSQFEYEIVANNVDVPGITFVDYYAINTMPTWLRMDKAKGRHHLVGVVPTNVVTGNKEEFEILVTTNAGVARQQLVVTYVDTPADSSTEG